MRQAGGWPYAARPPFFYGGTMRESIVIGQITKPQGVRGELKLRPLLDDVSVIRTLRRVYIGGAEYKVLSARFDAAAAYLILSGIADRDAAERLRGKDIEVPRADLPAPAEGRYYIVDVVGCTVRTAEGEALGTIAEVIPAHTDIYVLESGAKQYMFPAADGVVLGVDINAQVMTVDSRRLSEVMVEQ